MSKTDNTVPEKERRTRPRMEPYKRERPNDWEKELDEDDPRESTDPSVGP